MRGLSHAGRAGGGWRLAWTKIRLRGRWIGAPDSTQTLWGEFGFYPEGKEKIIKSIKLESNALS